MDKTERRWPTRCIIDADAIFRRRGRKEHQEWREILITCGRYQKFQETEACEVCYVLPPQTDLTGICD